MPRFFKIFNIMICLNFISTASYAQIEGDDPADVDQRYYADKDQMTAKPFSDSYFGEAITNTLTKPQYLVPELVLTAGFIAVNYLTRYSWNMNLLNKRYKIAEEAGEIFNNKIKGLMQKALNSQSDFIDKLISLKKEDNEMFNSIMRTIPDQEEIFRAEILKRIENSEAGTRKLVIHPYKSLNDYAKKMQISYEELYNALKEDGFLDKAYRVTRRSVKLQSAVALHGDGYEVQSLGRIISPKSFTQEINKLDKLIREIEEFKADANYFRKLWFFDKLKPIRSFLSLGFTGRGRAFTYAKAALIYVSAAAITYYIIKTKDNAVNLENEVKAAEALTLQQAERIKTQTYNNEFNKKLLDIVIVIWNELYKKGEIPVLCPFEKNSFIDQSNIEGAFLMASWKQYQDTGEVIKINKTSKKPEYNPIFYKEFFKKVYKLALEKKTPISLYLKNNNNKDLEDSMINSLVKLGPKYL